jgi:hypothetical protein
VAAKESTKSSKDVSSDDEKWIADVVKTLPHAANPFDADQQATMAKAKRFFAVDTISEDENTEIAEVCSMLDETGSARVQLAAYLRGKYVDFHAPGTSEGAAFKDWVKENKKVAKSESTARRSLIFFQMCRAKPGLLGIHGAWTFSTRTNVAGRKALLAAIAKAQKADQGAATFWNTLPKW